MIVILALGITDPVESVTVPTIVAFSCPYSVPQNNMQAASKNLTVNLLEVMWPPRSWSFPGKNDGMILYPVCISNKPIPAVKVVNKWRVCCEFQGTYNKPLQERKFSEIRNRWSRSDPMSARRAR